VSAGSLCLVFNNVDDSSGIGRLCAWSVRTALAAGWRVTVLARDLAPDLRADVEWLPLAVPPRLHVVQWYAAELIARRALRGRRFDVLHVQQPQLAPLADVLHLHYLVGAARDAARGVPVHRTVRSRVGASQARATEMGEDRYLRRMPANLLVIPVSRYLRDVFIARFGPRERLRVLDSPAEAAVAPDASQRATTRRLLSVPQGATILGFLGGADARKGGAALLEAVAHSPDVHVLLGGAGVPDHPLVRDARRVTTLGYVADRDLFFAACDAFAAVSSFDPGPLTALEAAARGVPVIGTRTCGAVRDLADAGAAVLWEPGEDLLPTLRRMKVQRGDLVTAGLVVTTSRSSSRQGVQLLEIYNCIRHDKNADRRLT